MNEHTRHLILRSYVALARGEHFTESEIGETIDYIAPYSGRLIALFPAVQFNWTENADLIKEVCEARNISEEKFSELMIFPKPTYIQNLVYSSELRRVFGIGVLRFMQEFNNDGNFVLPSYRGFFAPKHNGRLITALSFYEMSKLRIKKAA
jgi:hypothetical protein